MSRMRVEPSAADDALGSGPRPGVLSLCVLGVRLDLALEYLTASDAAEVAASWDGALEGPGETRALVTLVPRVGTRPDAGRAAESETETERASAADSETGSEVPGERVEVWGATLDELAERLSSTVTIRAINASADELLMLHAAGLADATGAVVALVGPSGRGKTTATRLLATRYGYLSDETVGVDAHGGVLAHRKPLSVIEQGRRHKVQRGVGELGLLEAPAAPYLAAVAVLDRREDGPLVAQVESLDTLSALSFLVAQTSFLPSTRAGLQWLAQLGDLTGGFHRVAYRDAESLPPAIEELLALGRAGDAGARLRPEPEVSAAVAPSDVREWDATAIETTPHLTFARAGVNDVVSCDGEIAVLAGTSLLRITGIGPLLWGELQAPATLEDLTARLVTEYGDPPGGGARQLVAQALADLSRVGALRVLQEE